MAFKYLRSANLKNKTVLVRVGVDVPLTKDGAVADDFRLRALLPTIGFLRGQGCKVILVGHLGRPEGKWLPEYSLRPVARHFADLLKARYGEGGDDCAKNNGSCLIFYSGDIRKVKEREAVAALPSHAVVFLENIRYYPEEKENNSMFAKHLASLANAYVDEAFSVAHRKDASLVAVTKYLPSYVGLQLEQEIKLLNRVMERPKKPFVVLMGGIKISDKAKTLQYLGKKADTILLAGGLANLFFLSRGYEIGLSKAENDSVKLAFQMDKNFKGKLELPLDVVVADKQLSKASIRVCSPHEVKKKELILDIGPKTILRYAGMLKKANTIVWNGPLGHFEVKPFHTGTLSLARIVGAVSKGKCFGVVGGGETVDAVRQAHQQDYVDHLSTGGGAMLEYLAGNKLPAIEALS